MKSITYVKPGLHPNVNANEVSGSEVRQNIWYIYTLFGIHRDSEQTLHLNVQYANSLWSINSLQIVFGYSVNVLCTAEYCLSLLGNTSTSNVRFVFTCFILIRTLFAFRCKLGLKSNQITLMNHKYFLILQNRFWQKQHYNDTS